MTTVRLKLSDAAVRRYAADPAVRELKDQGRPLVLRYWKQRDRASWYLVHRERWHKLGNWPGLSAAAAADAIPERLQLLATNPQATVAMVGTRVRTLDMVMDAILYGHKWAVDRAITKTYVKDVTDGLDAFMRDLKAQGAVINFEVYADKELTTASQLAQGKVYWRIRFTDVPPAENPNFMVEVTDQWLTEVLDA